MKNEYPIDNDKFASLITQLNPNIMKSLAFKSKIENNKIDLPENLFSEIKDLNHKEVRVILLMEEIDEFDENAFKEFSKLFFKKYASNLEKIKKMIENTKDE